MVTRLLGEPCSRWEPGEVLDLAALMLMSRHWPRRASTVGWEIARTFLDSRSGRGRAAPHIDLLHDGPDMLALLKFAEWQRHASKGNPKPLTRRVANTVMMEAVRAFVAVERALADNSEGAGGLRAAANAHADRVMRVILRRLTKPLYRSTLGRRALGTDFTYEDVETIREALVPRFGARVPDANVADEILRRMEGTPRVRRPRKRTVINRISLLRSLHRQ